MATVADIEPASLALTPGEPEVFTLTVRNDGEEVEAYHLSAVDDAADHVVIDPDTLLVHPGETGTATATITLEHTGRWSVGDMIVRFHIVPAVRPDEFLVVEAIATIQSFSDVAAVLSPPALEGRRSAEAEIAIANAGNAHTYADVAVSAGELVVSIDHAQAALPASSTESVDLTVRARELLWRGDPVQHPFVVTVKPEDQPAISLEGTFTQLPLLPGWTFKAAIGVAAAAALVLLLWLGAVFWGGLGRGPAAETVAASPTESTAPPTPVDVAVAFTPPDGTARAGDPTVATMEVNVVGAPEDALVAVRVTWPPVLALVEDECQSWVDPGTDGEPAGLPQSGDECLVDPSAGPDDQVEADLTFITPPAGLTTESDVVVDAAATRLVIIEGDDVETIEPGIDPESSSAPLPITATAYPFWMEVEVLSPSASDDGTRWGVVWVHRTLEENDEAATMAFTLFPPPFADAELMVAGDPLDDRPILPNEIGNRVGCDLGSSGDRCILEFVVDDSTFGDLDEWSVPVEFPVSDDRAAGLIVVRGASDVPVPEDQVLSAAAPLVVGGGEFPVDIELNGDDDLVTATLKLTQSTFASDSASSESGSRMLTVTVSWPEALSPSEMPEYCEVTDQDQRELVCRVVASEAPKLPDIEVAFAIDDDSVANVSVGAQGEMLTFAPDGTVELPDGVDGPPGWPLRWIASDVETLELD